MSTTIDTTITRTPPDVGTGHAKGGWIEHWDPEDEEFWESTGRKVARRNLVLVDLRRAPGLQHLGPLDDRRHQPGQHRDHPVGVGAVPPHRRPQPGRDRSSGSPTRSPSPASAAGPGRPSSAALLFIPTLLLADPRAQRLAGRPAPRHPAVDPDRVLGDGRLRRRQLLVVDVQHLVLLSGAQEGRRARPQRRRRQPRRGRRPAPRARWRSSSACRRRW